MKGDGGGSYQTASGGGVDLRSLSGGGRGGDGGAAVDDGGQGGAAVDDGGHGGSGKAEKRHLNKTLGTSSKNQLITLTISKKLNKRNIFLLNNWFIS